jgi:predicted regulator of Ras-like GTPase activity (Roadblock/LC7/MglB family)
MTGGDVVWSLESGDLQRLDPLLQDFLRDTRAHYVLLVDRAGRLLSAAGHPEGLDATAFASLAAADFAAGTQLAQLLGETEFSALYHQGDGRGMYLADVAGQGILAAVFGQRSTLGLLRLKARETVPLLAALLDEVAARGGMARVTLGSAWFSDAELEIDRLFGD